MFDLKERNVVVTGAAGLLGEQHCIAIAEAGGTPIMIDLDSDRLDLVATKIKKEFGIKVLARELNIVDENGLEKLKNECILKYGKIDALINNAAINPKVQADGKSNFSRVENFALSEWDKALEVGLKGAFLCSKIFGLQMNNQASGGNILNIASDLGIIAPNQSIYKSTNENKSSDAVKPVTYSVVKHGLIGLTRYFSTYWPTKVRCNALCPGGVDNGQSPEFINKISPLIPMGRMARVDEYKGTIVYMLSDASSYMTGAVLSVDGGRTAW